MKHFASTCGASASSSALGLPLGQHADRRMPADGIVVLPHDSGAVARDVTRQRTPRKPRSEKIDNVRVAEQVVEKRFHGRGGIRPAQLEQYDADFFLFTHERISIIAAGDVMTTSRPFSSGGYHPANSPCAGPPRTSTRKTPARSQYTQPPENSDSSFPLSLNMAEPDVLLPRHARHSFQLFRDGSMR